MSYALPHNSSMLPARGRAGVQPAAGQPLWGAPRRRQPIAAVIALAMVTLLVAAPAAMSSSGLSSNPLQLMHEIGTDTYQISGLVGASNTQLDAIESHTDSLALVQSSMANIATSMVDLHAKSDKLGAGIAQLGQAVAGARTSLTAVNTKLTTTAGTMGGLGKATKGSLSSTKTIVSDFQAIDGGIAAMKGSLDKTITIMSGTVPLTQQFAQNQTRLSVVGGDGTKYGVPNILPGNLVMSIVLPMIQTMQQGGSIKARKDSAQASNILVGTLLNKQVPDGTNIEATVLPYDGTYGLPAPDWFVTHQVDGF